MSAVRIDEIIQFAEAELPGPLYTDTAALERYATDMGMYRIPPDAVYRVVGAEDLARAVRFAAEHQIPLVPRAGGSNTGGTAIGTGLVLLFDGAADLSFIEGPFEAGGEQRVRVGAAVRHDRLQRHLAASGRYLPSDPSSGPLSLIGGNVATKASGPHALRHGAIDRYIRGIRYVASDGRIVDSAAADSAERELIEELRRELKGMSVARAFLESRKSMKSASGYNLYPLLTEKDNGVALAQLFAGSLGTLGFVTEVTLSTEELASEKSGLLLYFASLEEAGAFTEEALRYSPAAIEILNRSCLDIAQSREPSLGIPPESESMLILEFEGPDRKSALTEARHSAAHRAISAREAHDASELDALWRVRKRLLLELRNFRPGHTAPALVNDIGVPVTALAPFIAGAEEVFRQHGLLAPIYGHAGDGNLHLRPLFDTGRNDLPETLAAVAEQIYELVIRHGGTITGEHGVGRQRARFLRRELPPELFRFMRRVKSAFDPQNICNPEAMFESQAITDNLYLQ